jgi:formyltetrahydrofolate deformylase
MMDGWATAVTRGGRGMAALSRAVQWHSEDRVIRSGNHTIVFA